METSSFCANPKCHLNGEKSENSIMHGRLEVMKDGKWVEIRCHLYMNADRSREFYLCDICHSAVEMMKPKA